MQEMVVRSLGREAPLEKEMATHSSVLAWETPWTEKPVHERLQWWGHTGRTRPKWPSVCTGEGTVSALRIAERKGGGHREEGRCGKECNTVIEMYIRSPQSVTELLKLSLFPDIKHMPNTRMYTYTVIGTSSQNLRKQDLGSLRWAGEAITLGSKWMEGVRVVGGHPAREGMRAGGRSRRSTFSVRSTADGLTDRRGTRRREAEQAPRRHRGREVRGFHPAWLIALPPKKRTEADKAKY